MSRQIQTQPVFGRTRHIHMVGIGGIGMAEILLFKGFKVSGSDQNRSETTDRLEELGATIYFEHRASNIEGADVVVYTSAVKADENVETAEADARNVPVIKRSEMLAELMRMKFGIGIAGTHGKTTTTTLTGHVVQDGQFDPTIIVGGRVHSFDKTNAVVGKGDIIIVEADEYDRTFLQLSPSMVVITNIEAEHMDIYEDLDDVKSAFIEFANKVPFYGSVIVCLDNPEVRSILPDITRRTVSYGYNPQAQVRAVDVHHERLNSRFKIISDDDVLGEIRLQAPGHHNIQNALAAVAAGLELGMPFDQIKSGLERFRGVFRRFQVKVDRDDLIVIDDYAHHPTEVQATIKAAREGWPERRIVAVFQPHLYSRTQQLYKEFGLSFFDAEVLVVTDIYPSREEPIEGVSGKLIAETASDYGHKDVHYIPEKSDIAQELKDISEPGDLFITMGAGDIYKYGEAFAEMMAGSNS
ncbi:MAG: UDP-N-acetylmuramate--L-alanine ligase [Bacteroidetes bacterium]|jgi:UDP-N-acetylmuramate--alanine ligase|nr:UDP-N-acetylmuramate--L-alanine ligase [Bacteroidota bacterium]